MHSPLTIPIIFCCQQDPSSADFLIVHEKHLCMKKTLSNLKINHSLYEVPNVLFQYIFKFLYKYADIVWSSRLVSCQLWKKHNDPINFIVDSSSAIFGGRISIG